MSGAGAPHEREWGSHPLVVQTPVGAFVRVDDPPRPGPAGLVIAVAIVPAGTGRDRARPQVALAHAQDATGWSVGVGVDGRVTLTVGTGRGPVGLRAGDPVTAGERIEILARIPGEAGGRLELEVSAPGGSATAGAALAASVLPAPGPLLWGCRAVRRGQEPELAFHGLVAGPILVADASARGTRDQLRRHPALVAAWDLSAVVGCAAPA